MTEPFAPLSISQAPHPEASYRHATRLLSMVHELHKVGYQRLRISAGLSPSGMYWRCSIQPASFSNADSAPDPSRQRLKVTYSSSEGREYFGWTDAAGDSARALGAKFLERFPAISAAGVGLDWSYAGWFSHVLARAEHGELPIFYADWDIELPDYLRPPPPPDPHTVNARQPMSRS